MITPKYKVGDICIVIGGKHKENIGKRVTLVQWVNPGAFLLIESPLGGLRHISGRLTGAWIVEGENLLSTNIHPFTGEENHIVSSVRGFREHLLMKIGDIEPDVTLVEEKEKPCHA